MALLSREQILARKVAGKTEVVPLSDGAEVEVRGLTRGEATETSKLDDNEEIEILALSFGLVTPHLTPADVREWRNADGSGDVQTVVEAIQRLSGSAPGQGKEATKSVS